MGEMQIVAASQKVEAQYVELMVPLYSYGCERKVKKTLSNLKGIYSVNVDHHEQKVTVWGICNKDDVLQRIRSKRKDARFWNPQDNPTLTFHKSQSLPNSPPPPCPRNHHNKLPNKPYLTLIRAQSINWKGAWKKVFTRSYSF